jgi:hypothetical protein
MLRFFSPLTRYDPAKGQSRAMSKQRSYKMDDTISADQGIFNSVTVIVPHGRCSIGFAMLGAMRWLSYQCVLQACKSICSEIILSELDLDNTSERTCVALIPSSFSFLCITGD